ncbi:MAG: Mbeg1-like protein [Bacilli bacterium]
MSESRSFGNYLDFVAQYSIFSLNEVPFLDADSIVFSAISYFPFEKLVPVNDKFRPELLGSLCEKWVSSFDVRTKDYSITPDLALAMKLMLSLRYSQILVEDISYVFADDVQFCSMTLILPDDTFLIVYRGTDFTINGWVENFNLMVSSNLTCHNFAKSSLLKAMKKHPKTKFRLAGHSKGGNLAVVASSSLSEKENPYLLNVYSLDGVGSLKDVFESPGHERIKERIVKMVPEDDIVGGLLYAEPNSYVLKTATPKDFISSHFLQNWIIDDGQIRKAASQTEMSCVVTMALNELALVTLDTDEKKKAVSQAIGMTLIDTGIRDAQVIFDNPVAFLNKFVQTARKDPTIRKAMFGSIREVINAFRKSHAVVHKNFIEEKKAINRG